MELITKDYKFQELDILYDRSLGEVRVLGFCKGGYVVQCLNGDGLTYQVAESELTFVRK